MGTTTYLGFINACLKRVRVIQGDAGALTTASGFTDSGRQTQIDLMLQLSNEAFHTLYGMGLYAVEMATATITLITNTREYSLPTDFERVAGRDYGQRVLRAATKQLNLGEYPGGYQQMLVDQGGLASIYQGEPNAWCLSPAATTTIRLDRDPTSDDNGKTYRLSYEKRIGRTTTQATETLPFSDTVADALVPVVAAGWQAEYKKEFDAQKYRQNLARSVSHLTQTQPRYQWGPGLG